MECDVDFRPLVAGVGSIAGVVGAIGWVLGFLLAQRGLDWPDGVAGGFGAVVAAVVLVLWWRAV